MGRIPHLQFINNKPHLQINVYLANKKNLNGST